MEKINVAELLKDCPSGMELDCTLFDDVKFETVANNSICIRLNNGESFTLSPYGNCIGLAISKCVIFPKGKTTWEGFQRPFKDGDIVAYVNPHRANLQVFIFKSKKENNTLSSCYLMLDGDELDLEEGMYYVTRLATEEEKQKLFDAIKANGYKWNSETKTLEKLIEPKFKVGDKIKHKTYTSIGDVVTEIKDDYYILNAESALPFVFQDEYELVPNKFDINTLKPFDEVLTRANDDDAWVCNLYSHRMKDYYVVLNAELARQCIPFEGNQHLLGTANDCDEFYKTW